MKYNFNNKSFNLIDNSKGGTVSSDTSFAFRQKGNLVTADYYGGSIVSGNIVARLDGKYLFMLYHCMTKSKELKAGKAIAKLSMGANKKIVLNLEWEWIHGDSAQGKSSYIEQ